MIKSRLREHLALIFFGLLLALVFLEIILRIGGFLFFQIQLANNLASLKESKIYPILCIGESTTGLGDNWAYPAQLEQILNQRQKEIHFSVINAGIPSATTNDIVKQLAQDLEKFKPRLVVAMIGVNDTKDTSAHNKTGRVPPALGNHLRTVKMFHLLQQHLQWKWKEWQANKKKEALLKKAKIKASDDPSLENLIQVAKIYGDLNQPTKRKIILDQVLRRNPKNPLCHSAMTRYYADMRDYPRMQAHLEKVIGLLPSSSPDKMKMLNYLAVCLVIQKKYERAQEIYNYIIALDPPPAYLYIVHTDLVNMALARDKIDHARKLYFQQLAYASPDSGPYTHPQLVHYYRARQQYAEIESLLREALTKIPPSTRHSLLVSSELGYTLIDQKKPEDAEDIFSKIRQTDVPKCKDLTNLAGQGLITALKAQGKTKEAELVEVHILPSSYYFPATVTNYKQIYELVRERGLPLVCVQYPLRPIAPLKQIMGHEQDIFFVDNEHSFKKALMMADYDAYFTDRFAGDFGHCTKKGNRLLAQNVADVILQEVFQNKR